MKKIKTQTEELHYLGQMLTSTTIKDSERIETIIEDLQRLTGTKVVGNGLARFWIDETIKYMSESRRLHGALSDLINSIETSDYTTTDFAYNAATLELNDNSITKENK